jgi:hypothetical protein
MSLQRKLEGWLLFRNEKMKMIDANRRLIVERPCHEIRSERSSCYEKPVWNQAMELLVTIW